MSKFLNISTDNTLGGDSPSDETVSSQKAVKTYIDAHASDSSSWGSITGTLSDQTDLKNALDAKYDASNPNGYTSNVGTVTSVNNVSPVNGNVTLSIPTVDSALSTTSTNAVQNKVITSALNGKLDGFTLRFAGNWSGGVHAVNFVTIDYSECNSENGVFIKFSMVNSHGNGQAGRFLQDVVLNVTYSGGVVGTLYRYFAVPIDQASSEYYGSHSYGDVFWVNDTTNKIVKFYVLMHQYSYTSQSPYFRLNASTKGVITQSSGGPNKEEYSSGTRVWTTINWFETDQTYSATSDKPQSGIAVASALGSYVPTSRTINSKALSSNITLTASDVGALPSSTVIPTVNNATLTIQKNGTTVKTFTANASTDVTANIIVPTKVSDLTNDSGFISGITSSDVTTALGYTPYNSSNPSGYQANVIETVKVNGTALTPSSKAVDVSVPTESTVSGWGFTKNTGTVTSVNNVSPVNGNVSLSIPTVNNATLTLTQGGTTKGTFTANASSNVTIDLDSGGSVDVDNKSITTNSSDEIQAIGLINKNPASGATNPKYDWVGTLAEYNSQSVATAHPDWICYITDDVSGGTSVYTKSEVDNLISTTLSAVYPVGSVYIGTTSTCPMASLISGSTWTLVSSDRVLQGSSGSHIAGTTIEAGLPNITGSTYITEAHRRFMGLQDNTGCIDVADSGVMENANGGSDTGGNMPRQLKINASLSSSIYGNSTTVQPPAYVVNIWERTA